jgi:predicted ribosome quality control (RQC) complex YloA/Tae2 family protein
MAQQQPQKMSNLDYHHAAGELAQAKGGRLEQVYEVEDGTFRLRLSTAAGKLDVIAALGTRLHATRIIPESPPQPTPFASLLRKRLANAVVLEISQVALDRLVAVRLRKDAEYVLYFEMFAKGNLVLCDCEGRIIAAYREQKGARRVVARGEQYPLPAAAASPFDPGAAEKALEGLDARDAAKKIALAPAYFDDFAASACLDDGKKAAQALEKYVSQAEFTVYYDEKGGATGFSAVRLNAPAAFLKTEPADSKVFSKFSDALDEYYSRAAVCAPQKGAKNARLEKLLRQKDLQEKSVAQALAAADELQAMGDAIYLNYDRAEAALGKAKAEGKGKTEMEI